MLKTGSFLFSCTLARDPEAISIHTQILINHFRGIDCEVVRRVVMVVVARYAERGEVIIVPQERTVRITMKTMRMWKMAGMVRVMVVRR
jgi:hypothetical protein